MTALTPVERIKRHLEAQRRVTANALCQRDRAITNIQALQARIVELEHQLQAARTDAASCRRSLEAHIRNQEH